VETGEVHALLGENGAGKSTLVKVLMGLVRPDAGRLALGGRPVDLARWSPAAALRAGVGMVHQHSCLVPALSAVENLSFGALERGFRFRPSGARARVAALAARFGLDAPLDVPVESLSVGQAQRVEILRALGRGARILVLDEPTAALAPGETRELFAAVRRLAASGRAVIFISHKLEEIRAVADRVTVLCRRRRVATRPTRTASGEELGRLMLGRDLAPLERPRSPSPGRGSAVPALEIRGLEAPGLREASRLEGVDLRVERGEILGVAGIDGNGQRELEEVLAGVRPARAGRLWVGGRPAAFGVRALRAAGVAHLSGERETAGLIPGMSVAENLILKGSYDDRRYFLRGWIDRAAARRAGERVLRRFDVRPGDPDADIATLSGGNAQKVAVARELEGEPPVLVAVNPTRGLDVGSARFVHEQLLARRGAGGAVLLVSTDLDEVLALADRRVALVAGRVVAVPEGADRGALGAILLGSGS